MPVICPLLSGARRNSVRRSAERCANYRAIIRKKSISEITAKDIIRWQNQLLAMRDKNGQPYSPTYLKAIHNQLTAIFTHAFKFYGLKTNPASKAGSVGKKHAEEMQFWTLDEYSRFAGVAVEDPIAFYAFEVLYWCGIRLGELLALTYEDVNFENKTLRVNKSYTVVRGEEIISDPKTPKSKRTIIMPDFLIEELQEYTAFQYSPKPTDRVFKISKNYLRAHLRKNAELAGIKTIRVHDLRHSHVSHLIELGFSPVAIAERVGHESIEITLRYAHLFPTKQSEMAAKLGEAARAL